MRTFKIDIIAVGKLKERYWTEAAAEYLKRLKPYVQVHVKEVDDISPVHAGTREKALNREATHITKMLAPTTYIIALDRKGKAYSSEQFAELLHAKLSENAHHITFVIGGSDGLAPSITAHANESLSFGAITLPHNIARVVLLEQVYRAFKILRNEPYHK